ncbi:MAG: transposase [Chloroflexi bacterium]|nr:transposase [Chloroflexota bacterium]
MPEIDKADGTASAAKQAEKRTEETRSFMRSVRRATRRRYTPEEKIRIVLEGFRREATVNDLCRREGINPANYYSWTKEFMEAGKERLARNTVRDATRHEIEQLKRENGDLKEIVPGDWREQTDLLLETHRLKKTAIPPLNHGTAGRT